MKKQTYFILGAVIILIAAGTFFLTSFLFRTDVKKKYGSCIDLIHHRYVYTVLFSDTAIGQIDFIKTSDGKFIPYDEEKNEPNELIGIGMTVSENGTTITSAKTIAPWMNDNDQEALRETANEIIEYQHSLGNEMDFQLLRGRTISMEIYYNANKGRNAVESSDAIVLENGEAEMSIGFLKPKAGRGNYNYAKVDLSKVNDALLEKGNKLSMLVIDDEGFDSRKEMVVTAEGKINNPVTGDVVYYEFPGNYISEGAPVFDKQGRLVAINTVWSDGDKALMSGKRFSFRGEIAAMEKRALQKEIDKTINLVQEIDEAERSQLLMDSILKELDTIGRSMTEPVIPEQTFSDQ